VSAQDDLRKRLEALNRRPLPERTEDDPEVAGLRRKLRERRKGPERAPDAPRSQTPGEILYRRDLPQPGTRAQRPIAPAHPVELTTAVDGREIEGPHGGRAFLVVKKVRELEDAATICEAFHSQVGREDSNARRWVEAMCGAQAVTPEELIFVDLETTGLAGTPLFLIGTMGWEKNGLVVRQYFARNYAEERAAISLFAGALAERKLLVSFNGKSFDLPYVRVRAAATGVPFDGEPPHLDLLHVSRRIWRGRLPDCRLQTLERIICGRMRLGDIPGE